MSAFLANTRAVWRVIRSTRPIWAHTVMLCCFALPQAHADPGNALDRTPPNFNLAACYELVRHEGRMIAWARWEERFTLDKTRSAPVAEDTPAWVSELIQGWIADAYDWRATDEQIWQWADELGSTENLPSAQRLTKHQTIAIWLRRIARQCASRLEAASAQDSTVARGGE